MISLISSLVLLLLWSQAEANISPVGARIANEKKRIEERVKDFEALQEQRRKAQEGDQEKIRAFKKERAKEAEAHEQVRLKQVLGRMTFGGYPEDLPSYADYLKALTNLEAEREKIRQNYVLERGQYETAIANVPNVPEEVELDLVAEPETPPQEN